MRFKFNVTVEKDEKITASRDLKMLCEKIEKVFLKTTLNYYDGSGICAKFWLYYGDDRKPFYKLAIYDWGEIPDMSQMNSDSVLSISTVYYDGNIAILLCTNHGIQIAYELEAVDKADIHEDLFNKMLVKNLEMALIDTDYFLET